MRRSVTLAALVVLSAIPSFACSPNPTLMQDECYSSCANQALFYHDQCSADCVRSYCNTSGQSTMCEPGFYSCSDSCNNMKCNNLNECQDYCHEW